jgi:UDP-glucose 4-epimerase
LEIKNNILITGGSGFVGTQVADELIAEGHNVTVVDRKLKGNSVYNVRYVEEDYLDFIQRSNYRYDTVIHLAAEHLVEQSVGEPEKYYTNNVVKMKAMLDRMRDMGIMNIVFSSSGNTYGRQGETGPLKEDLYYDPQNPYASSKVAGEILIKDYAKAYGMNYVIFRYFNAAGADAFGRYGYIQRPATHVIPIICNKILNNELFKIYGNDYPTKDGTCVRDYVHVSDLAKAHSKAMQYLIEGRPSEIFNIGGGNGGVSVKELCHYAAKVVGKDHINIEYAGRRAGDPAMLIADISKAEQLLGWKPTYTIEDTIKHAWLWEKDFAQSK